MAPDTPDIQMREFGFSETTIRQGNRNLVAFVLLCAFVNAAFAWHFFDFRIEEALIVAGICILTFGPFFAIEAILLSRRSRKLKVLVHEDRIVKQCGKKQRTLLWKDIAGIKTVRSRRGGVAQITLYPKKPKIPIYLHGFRDMEDLANLMRERTSEGVVLCEKRSKLDWQNPFVCMLVGGVPTVVAIFIIASMGSKAMDIFAILFALSVGLLLLVFRPFTKFDLGFKWIELIAGIGMLILGIHMLRCLLTLGRIP